MAEYFVKRPGEALLVITDQLRDGDVLATQAEIDVYKAAMPKYSRKGEIRMKLEALDAKSQRALRELALPETGETAKEYARGVLSGIETQAKALRAELSGLGG